MCYSEAPHTCLHSKGGECNPHTPHFLNFHFNIILTSKLGGRFVEGYLKRIWLKAV